MKSLSPGALPFLFTLVESSMFFLREVVAMPLSLLCLLPSDLKHISIVPIGPDNATEGVWIDYPGRTRLCLLHSVLQPCHIPGDRLLRKQSQKEETPFISNLNSLDLEARKKKRRKLLAHGTLTKILRNTPTPKKSTNVNERHC